MLSRNQLWINSAVYKQPFPSKFGSVNHINYLLDLQMNDAYLDQTNICFYYKLIIPIAIAGGSWKGDLEQYLSENFLFNILD